MAIVNKEAYIDQSDPYERHRTERQRVLEQRVAETLALKPSKPCPLLKGNDHGTYKLTIDEEQREIRNYETKSRQVRIMQVRAQEMLLAAQRVGEFRQRKKNEKQKLLQVLKEAWQEEQKKRIADIEEDFVKSCQGIGQSHDAAQEVIKNLAAIAEEKVNKAEENRIWEALRYQKAKQEESVRRSKVKFDLDLAAAKDRRRLMDIAANMERTRAQNCALRAKSKPKEDEKRNACEDGKQKFLSSHSRSHDFKQNFMQSRLAGAPNDYQDTYFHSRFCVLKDRTNFNEDESAHEDQLETEIDAWEAAEVHLKSADLEKEHKAQIEKLWNNRKVERGQVAVAHLQKIALLEEELALELGEEQERKHQLQLIEELTKAAHVSTYKPDQRRQSGTELSANKEVDEREGCAPKNEDSGEHNMKEDPDTRFPAGHLDPALKPPFELVDEYTRKGDCNGEGERGMPAPDAEMCASDSAQEIYRKDADADERKDKVIEEDAEVIVVRLEKPEISATPGKPLTPRKPHTSRKVVHSGAETRISPYASPMTVNGNRFRGKSTAHDKASTNLDSKLPDFDPKGQSVHAPARASKGLISSSHVSSLPNLNSRNNVRKGNKSPQRLDSPGRMVPSGLESQGTSDQVKEVRNRSRKQSIQILEQASEKRSTMPAIPRRMECCSPECKKMTPRRHSNSWLTNVLEKLTWWRSHKEPPILGITSLQEKSELEGGQPSRAANRDIRKESTPKFPVKQVDVSSRSQAFTRSIQYTPKSVENISRIGQAERQSDEELGWYEACTKDIFSPEELEALQLELYGTWTDSTVSIGHNKAKTKRVMVRSGTGKLDNESEVSLQQEQNLPTTESSSRFKDPDCRPQSKEKTDCFVTCKKSNNDPRCHKFEDDEAVQEEDIHKNLIQRTPVKACPLSRPSCSNPIEKLAIQDGDDDLGSDLRKESCQPIRPPLASEELNLPGSQFKAEMGCQRSVRFLNECDSKVPGEVTSARDAAEKLILAWRTGQLGGNLGPVIDSVKQKSTQKSRKRRARTDEESHLDSTKLGPGDKIGQVSENSNRPRQGSGTKFRKWESLTVSFDSALQQEIQVANTSGLSRGQEKSGNAWTSPARVLSPSYLSRQISPACVKVEASRTNNHQANRNAQGAEIVPEARSLDFILGSLYAQVRELDERLRSVTSYPTGDSSAEESPSNLREATSTPLAEKTSPIQIHSKVGLKCSGVGERQGCKVQGVCNMEEENLVKPRSPKAVPVMSPKIGRHTLGKVGEGHACSPMSDNVTSWAGDPCFGVSKSKLDLLGQPPASSMDICCSNLSDLMEEMNGQSTLEQVAIQETAKCLSEKFPRGTESGTKNLRKEISICDIKDSASAIASKEDFPNNFDKSFQKRSGTTSRISLKSFAEMCPVKTEATASQSQAELDTKDSTDGPMPYQGNGNPQHSFWQSKRLSLSSIELIAFPSSIEEQLLLSGSVDFSPWNTEKLPDVSSSITTVGTNVHQSMECHPAWDGADVDCEGQLRPVYCHVKKESEWLLRGNKFKRKSKAYEKRRIGRVKSKQKRSLRKPFNPVALPPRHTTPKRHLPSPRRPSTATVLPKVSTTRIQSSPPLTGPLNFRKKELKLGNDASAKLNLSARSLPAQFPGSVTAEEVQKWLRREAVGSSGCSPDESLSRETVASIRHQSRFSAYKRSEVLEQVAGPQGKLLAKAALKIPDLGIKEASYRRKTVESLLESRRRPASAGSVLKC